MKNLTIIEKKPTVEEYIQLRNSIGWNILQHDKIEKGLDNSIYCVCVEEKGSIVGIGRIIGDGGTVFYTGYNGKSIISKTENWYIDYGKNYGLY